MRLTGFMLNAGPQLFRGIFRFTQIELHIRFKVGRQPNTQTDKEILRVVV